LHLLVVLTQDYDVALMNPPYGSGGRMPNQVQKYVEDNYEYTSEYYINFFEANDRLVRVNGRVGMLVPRSFMFLKSFQSFREDFIGGRGTFDFLTEFGVGILDNATVRPAGTVVRSDNSQNNQEGTFIRLDDVAKENKERSFLHASFVSRNESGIKRRYDRNLSEFDIVPGSPLTYWVPKEIREIYNSNVVLDAENGKVNAESSGSAKVGLQTSDD
ncbi:MAG: Eco57I restriction-modification methylase domain-containing protein, partial [Halobacteriaceae archaeon]